MAEPPSLQNRVPNSRRLRVFAFDPSLATSLQNFYVSEVAIKIPWEDLEEGPVGDYLEIIDYDPATGCGYPPVDLNARYVLAENGLPPSEGDPRFHQQMVYAVAMSTIKQFERALGRPVFWSDLRIQNGKRQKFFPVAKLRIYPHALREENAYYDPEKKAVLFGYFAARPQPGAALPGGMVFTCLSHDIIAHEMTHAILDGYQRYFLEPSNLDVLAFHEAFADIVALFQHFSHPEILRHQLARARGDLNAETLLGKLAIQFGRGIGHSGGLRDAIGGIDEETGKWRRQNPDPAAYRETAEPHARGAILVATIFDAFLAIYRSRTEDFFRIATGGTGVLPKGEIHPDLVGRLAAEAAKSAGHVLQICLRAIDYCPPVDLTFGDYLRALITADMDLVPDDDRNYRVAFIEAFRSRGIYPDDVRTLSPESLRWKPPSDERSVATFGEVLRKSFHKSGLSELWDTIVKGSRLDPGQSARTKVSRMEIQAASSEIAKRIHGIIKAEAIKLAEDGIFHGERQPFGFNFALGHIHDYKFEVHSVRPVHRIGPDGKRRSDFLIQITQRRPLYFDVRRQAEEEERYRTPGEQKVAPDLWECDAKFRGGATFLLDLETFEIRYAIYKNILSERRIERQRKFMSGESGTSLAELYFGKPGAGQRFAHLHGGDDLLNADPNH